MLQKAFSFGGMLVLAGAAFLGTAGPGWAAGRGGGGGHFGGGHFGGGGFGGARFGGARFGGTHFGGARVGGYRGGIYRGGHFGYRNGFGYRHYSGYFPYAGYYYPSYNYYPYYGTYPDYYSNTYPDSYSYGSDPLGGADSYAPATASYANTALAKPRKIARLTVRVPANAKLWFDGKKMTTRGRVRRFKSPPLKAGQRYYYQVKARWKHNGRTVTQTRKIAVTPGKDVNIRFPARSLTGGKKPPTQTSPTKTKSNR